MAHNSRRALLSQVHGGARDRLLAAMSRLESELMSGDRRWTFIDSSIQSARRIVEARNVDKARSEPPYADTWDIVGSISWVTIAIAVPTVTSTFTKVFTGKTDVALWAAVCSIPLAGLLFLVADLRYRSRLMKAMWRAIDEELISVSQKELNTLVVAITRLFSGEYRRVAERYTVRELNAINLAEQECHVRIDQTLDAMRSRDEMLKRLISKRLDEIHALDKRIRLLTAPWRQMTGTTFERYLAEIFRCLGFHVEETGQSGDQGVDLIARRNGRCIAIQVKGYLTSAVGNDAVQQAYAGMAYYRCDSSMVITNACFTSGATKLAQVVKCRLIDHTQIEGLIWGRVSF